jgi:hypothetical protein
VNLKAIWRDFWNFFFGAGFAAPQSAVIAPDAARENGGKLCKALISGEFGCGRVQHATGSWKR